MIKKINIDEIKTSKSVNNRDLEVYLLLKKNIKKYGQLYPILIDANFNIIKGNTIYKILKELNHNDIWVNIISIDNKDQLYLELKLLKNEPNPIGCFKLMKNIDLSDNCLPYNKRQINDFINLLSFNWNSYKTQKSDINDLF